MYFWLKLLHIAAMALWFTGLLLLPRLFLAQASRPDDGERHTRFALGRTLYTGVMTPAGALTIILGAALIAYDIDGWWLPAKLVLVATLVLLHLYAGQLLFDLGRGHVRHGSLVYRALGWAPVPLMLGIAALAAAKPGAG